MLFQLSSNHFTRKLRACSLIVSCLSVRCSTFFTVMGLVAKDVEGVDDRASLFLVTFVKVR